jgi:nucleoside-diphosphate-sugar epimerase
MLGSRRDMGSAQRQTEARRRASMKVCVTGASGRAGRAVVADLVEHGHQVVATDLAARAPGQEELDFLRADLTDYGQATEVLQGVAAVIHLANIPAPGIHTPAVTYNQNMAMNFNVFMAATQVGLRRVVWASSETTLGLPFDVPPRYAPIDEDHYPVPTSTYALSKVASETIAGHIAEWSGIPFIALRFSNILGPRDYQEDFPSYWADPALRQWNLWGYIDERDVGLSCRLALEADVSGAASFIIAAADTVMPRPSAELMREVFPGVPLTRDVPGNGTLLSIDRAREVLGFTPQHSWRDHVAAPAAVLCGGGTVLPRDRVKQGDP